MADANETTPSGVKRKRDFFDDEDFSDVIIKFGEDQVLAHKVILARGSLWFDRALSGNFSEANKKVIELHDDPNPNAVMVMLKHLYGMTYGSQEVNNWCDEAEIDLTALFHLSVFMLGDKYDIDSLRTAAAQCFNQVLEEERSDKYFSDDTIYAIQKLLGPHAPELADGTLTEDTDEFVVKNYYLMMQDSTFRSCLGRGVMFDRDLAEQFLEMVSKSMQDSG